MNNIKIDINNYEAFALDYLEGNLSSDVRTSFDQFLSNYPSIEEELSDLLDFRVEGTSLTYDEKEKLRKPNRKGLGKRFILLTFLASMLILATAIFLLNQSDARDEISIQSNFNNSIQHSANSSDKKVNQQLSEVIVDTTDQKTSSEVRDITRPKNNLAKKSKAADQQHYEKTVTIRNNNKIKTLSKNTESKSSTENAKKTQRIDDKQLINNSKTNPQNIERNQELLPHDKLIKSKEKDTNNKRRSMANNDSKSHQSDVVADHSEQSISNEKNNNAEIKASAIAAIQTLQTPTPLGINISNQQKDVAFAESINKSLPVIKIPDEVISSDEVIASITNNDQPNKNKKLKIRFRNFLPEQFAGLTKEDIKRSLIPETFTAR